MNGSGARPVSNSGTAVKLVAAKRVCKTTLPPINRARPATIAP